MVSEERKKQIKDYKDRMKEASKYLPVDWIQKILAREKLTAGVYRKKYNVLVNLKNGRSFISTLTHPKLYEAILELAQKYKAIEF